MNFGTGVGNVGMYSIGGGTLTNGSATVSPTITVSASDVVNKLYGIGMAAGYVNDAGTLVSTGNIVNYGTIKVEKDKWNRYVCYRFRLQTANKQRNY